MDYCLLFLLHHMKESSAMLHETLIASNNAGTDNFTQEENDAM